MSASITRESKKFNINILENGKKNKILRDDFPIHSWYQFVLGYPPHLVQYYLSKFDIQKNNIILDPFCGTGTTPVECVKKGIENYGIEVNRMAYFASKVKTTLDIDSNELKDTLGYIVQSALITFKHHKIKDYLPIFFETNSIKQPTIIDEIPLLNPDQLKIIPSGFISDSPLRKILILKAIIDTIPDTKTHDFFTLSLANLIVKKGGNIAFGPEIYRTKPKTDIDALNYFITNSTQMIQDLEEFRNGQTVTTIIHGDSRDVHKCLNPELLGQIDCIITSPPYPNEKDYTRSTRLESVLLGFIKDKHDLRLMKESLLRSNSRNIYVSDSDGNFVTQFDSIEKIANDIEEKRVSLNKSSGFEKQYHKIVRHYFGGMYLHFKNLKPYLSSNAKLAYVVGDQMSFFQTHIPTAQILGEIAESLNYKVKEVELWRTRLATATKLNIDENILILENV